MMEEWRIVKDYTNYEVSSYGNIKNIITNKLLKKTFRRYELVALFNCGLSKQFRVHRIVADAFIVNSDNKPFIDHIDGDTKNNNISNLRWCSHQENLWNKVHKGYHITSNGKYNVSIRDNDGKKKYLGTFITEEDARKVYQDKAKELRGHWVRTLH